jgi:hypothetical protein
MSLAANSHKVGDSFTRLLPIPPAFGDGYFVGWVTRCQVRGEQGELISEVTCEWLDPLTTRDLKLRVADTTMWNVGRAFIDVQFTRTSDGEVMSTTTAEITLVKDNTV